MLFTYLNKLDNFSSLSIIILHIGMILKVIETAREINYRTQGDQFIKNIVFGNKLSEMPDYLLFTAPYRLCEGGCKDQKNDFVMAFPLYVGKKGKQQYKNLYQRDYNKIHSSKPNAPFKKKSTRHPFTPCPILTIPETTTTTSTEPSTSETETSFLTTKYSIPETDMPSQQLPMTMEPSVNTRIGTPITTTEPVTIPVTEPPVTTTEYFPELVTLTMSNEKETTRIETDFSIYATDYGNAKQNLLTSSRETYITNANGVRCPRPICRNKNNKVTAQIVSPKFDPSIYNSIGGLDSINYLYSD